MPGETVVTDGQMSLKPGSSVGISRSGGAPAQGGRPAKPRPS